MTKKYTYPGTAVNNPFVYLGVHAIAPWVPVNPDGTPTYMPALNGQGIGDGYAAVLQYGKSRAGSNHYDLINTVSATVTPFDALTVVGSYSYQLHPYSSFLRRVRAPWSNTPDVVNYVGNDNLNKVAELDQYHVVNAYATYEPSLENHHIKVTAGYNQEQKRYSRLSGSGNNLISEDLNELALASDAQNAPSDAVRSEEQRVRKEGGKK